MKRKTKPKAPAKKITPEQALEFFENFRLIYAGKDEPTQPISIRIPANVLNAYKTLAHAENRSYQTMMNQALREFLLKK